VLPFRIEWTPWMAPLTPMTVPKMATNSAVERFLEVRYDLVSAFVFT